MGAAQLPVRRARRTAYSAPPSADAGLAAASPLAVLGPRSPAGVIGALVAVACLLELLLAWMPALRLWVWVATVVSSVAGAAACVAAAQRDGRFILTWYAAAGGC